MKATTLCYAALALGLSAGVSHATITLTANNFIVVNSPAGITQNNWTIDSYTDFLSAVVYIELTAGEAHLPPEIHFFSVTTNWDFIEPGSFYTFVTANGNTNTILAGGAGDLDPSAPAAVTLAPQLIGIAWASPGADIDDIGRGLPMGRFSFTDDARGTWQLLFTNAGGDRLTLGGVVINGAMVPEPATLGMLSLCGLLLLSPRKGMS